MSVIIQGLVHRFEERRIFRQAELRAVAVQFSQVFIHAAVSFEHTDRFIHLCCG